MHENFEISVALKAVAEGLANAKVLGFSCLDDGATDVHFMGNAVLVAQYFELSSAHSSGCAEVLAGLLDVRCQSRGSEGSLER